MPRAFEPSATRPWDRRLARHLLERAGFGGPPAEVDALVALGPRDAVAKLVEYPAPRDEPAPDFLTVDVSGLDDLDNLTDEQRRQRLQEIQRQARQGIVALKAWWLQRMVATAHPLEEKLTLFWHGHFATEAEKVRHGHALWRQNQTLRRHARGDFGDLLLAVSRDPAMLVYLDNQLNQEGRPNENYARELFELFSLGIGHYTEQDIEETARAFTGWGVRGMRQQFGQEAHFQFNPRLHDDGEKTVFGVTGRLDGADIIPLILRQPSCAPFVLAKLYRHFVTDQPTADDRAVIDDLADLWRDSGYHLQPVLQALFTSEAFYAERQFGAQIKSPVQLVVGTLRRCGLDLPAEAGRGLVFMLAGMGQNLFDPPNVAGWPGGEDWINTSTLLQRYNLIGNLLGARRIAPLDPARFGLDDDTPAERAAAQLVEAFLAVPLGDEQLAELAGYLAERGGGPFGEGDWLRAGVRMLTSTPHYQVC